MNSFKMEKKLVKELGQQIGYGNMMQLARECWKEDMIEKGYPTDAAMPSWGFTSINLSNYNKCKTKIQHLNNHLNPNWA